MANNYAAYYATGAVALLTIATLVRGLYLALQPGEKDLALKGLLFALLASQTLAFFEFFVMHPARYSPVWVWELANMVGAVVALVLSRRDQESASQGRHSISGFLILTVLGNLTLIAYPVLHFLLTVLWGVLLLVNFYSKYFLGIGF
jgi:hypothetical protein